MIVINPGFQTQYKSNWTIQTTPINRLKSLLKNSNTKLLIQMNRNNKKNQFEKWETEN